MLATLPWLVFAPKEHRCCNSPLSGYSASDSVREFRAHQYSLLFSSNHESGYIASPNPRVASPRTVQSFRPLALTPTPSAASPHFDCGALSASGRGGKCNHPHENTEIDPNIGCRKGVLGRVIKCDGKPGKDPSDAKITPEGCFGLQN